MKKVAVVSAILLAGSLAVGQSTGASSGSTKPTNVAEPNTDKPKADQKDTDTKKGHTPGKKGHKGGKKGKKGSREATPTPK
jgi:hypothetical protein